MKPSTLEAIARITARERLLIATSRGATMDEAPDKVAALADIARALDRLGVAYAVAGWHPLRNPRATVDIDIAVPSTMGCERLIETLAAQGSC